MLIVCTGISIRGTRLLENEYLGVLQRHWWIDRRALGERWADGCVLSAMVELDSLKLYNGELSSFRTALLPVIAAIGGVALPE